MREIERRIGQLEKRNPDHDPGHICLFTTDENGDEVLLATAPPDGPEPETDLQMTAGLECHRGPGLAYACRMLSDGFRIPVPLTEADHLREVVWLRERGLLPGPKL